MLSLSSGTKIAKYEGKKGGEHLVYIKDNDKKAPPEIDTTDEKKIEIFDFFIERNKKLRKDEIEELKYGFRHHHDTTENKKLARIYDDAKEAVSDSLKHYLDFPKTTELHAIIDLKKGESYRMFVSGLSESGKSFYIAQFLKNNKPKHIFIFSPVKDDPAYAKLKPIPLHLDLSTYAKDFEKEFEIEDIPAGSVVILDDTATDKYANLYKEVKYQLLERGRHLEISTIIVNHDAMAGNTKDAKAQLRECQYYVIFPRHNKVHCERLLKSYLGLPKDDIDMICDTDSRAILVKKSYPKYYIGEHTIGTLN
jgi:hypothetical protein